ncbi:MAG: hypothetical protein J5941_06405 [Solobacterium sp.]|nr:hypothetical protein [Solobacterium sp.]
MNQKRNTGFYIEAILLLLVFVFVIRILVMVNAVSHNVSEDARRLTDGVILASNGAELVLASDSPEELMGLLKEGSPERENSVITVRFDDTLEMNPAGTKELVIDWQDASDDFVHAVITVYDQGREVYTLTTGGYLEGGRP